MIFIKLFLIIVLTLITLVLAFSSRYRTVQRLTLLIFYLFLSFLILFPHYADAIASFFGIGRGVDLVIYLAIAILSLTIAILYAKTKMNERALVRIIRELAILKARKCP